MRGNNCLHVCANFSPISPLKVWANIQEYADPARLKFDLANPLQWRPVFPRATTQTLASIQMETLLYTTPNLANIKELEKEIYQVLVSKVEKWRGRFLTKWNRTCGRVLETILPLLERKRQGDLTPLRAADLAELGRVQSSYDVRGFPLHMPFTDAAAIVEALYNTDFYSNHDDSAEFALAVHVHPYVNNVCSVWLYAASLTRKQSGISPLKAGARAVLAGVSMFRAASASASRPAAY